MRSFFPITAKYSMQRHAVKSPPAQSDITDEQNSENDAPNLSVESSNLGLNREENLKNEQNKDGETLECLGERITKNLNLGKDESEMLSSQEKEKEFIEEKRVVDGTKGNDGISPINQGIVLSLDERGKDEIAVSEFKEIQGRSVMISSSASLPLLSSSYHEMEDENSHPPSQVQETPKDVIINQIQSNIMPRGSEAKGSFNLEIHKPTQHIKENKSSTSSQWNDQDSNVQSRAELLRRVDELRYQLVQDESDMYGTSHLQLKSSRLAHRRSLHHTSMMRMQESEPEIYDHSLEEGLRLSRQNVPNCVHCHALPPPPLGIFCINGLCMSCCHIYCSSSQSTMSGSGDWQYHASPSKPSYFLRSNSSSTGTEDLWLARSEQQQNVKKDHRVTKRHCRPIFGGANLITCYKCHKLIQMPDDMVISRRINKLRCGSCYKILTFEIPKELSREEIASNLLSNSYHSVVDSGPSSTAKSFSREGLNTIDVEGDKKKLSSLHSLMGYSSARDIIFQLSSDED